MSHPPAVKELAYSLDPGCWISYSGKPKAFKQLMDSRRSASLRKAEDAMRKADVRREHEERVTKDNKSRFAITNIKRIGELMQSGEFIIEDVERFTTPNEIAFTIKLKRLDP